MEDKLVSVISPMFNARDTVRATIESVIAQSYEDWELIIADDCSTDNGADIVKEYMDKEPRIRCFKMPENAGAAAARNAALDKARGRYIAFLDCDDIWDSEKLKTSIGFMKNKDAGLVYHSCDLIDMEGDPTGKVRHVPESADYKSLLKSNFIPCLTAVLDREKTGDIRMPLIRHEDYALWLELAKKDVKMAGFDKVLAHYRVGGKTLSSNKFKALSWRWKIYREYLHLGIFKSGYYFMWYAFSALKKY